MNLIVGTIVRWKQGDFWVTGKIASSIVYDDGSILIYEAQQGGARNIKPDRLQMQSKGPRGGKGKWVKFETKNI